MLNKKHSVKKSRIRHDWPEHIKKWKESKSNQTAYTGENCHLTGAKFTIHNSMIRLSSGVRPSVVSS